MSPWLTLELGYEMGYSPKDAIDDMSNDARKQPCLWQKNVSVVPALHLFKDIAHDGGPGTQTRAPLYWMESGSWKSA